MSAGGDPIAGRYRRAAAVASIGGVERHLAIDTDTDAQVEVSVFVRSGAVPSGFGELAGRLHAAAHPSLAPILAWTEPGDDATVEAVVVQPHVEGARLTSAVVLPRAVALAACADLAEALAVLHQADLIHGDVSAAAVVLDTQGRAVLFGAGSGALQAAAVGGVAADVDRDADMRGLGRLLYTLVCGVKPTRRLVAPLVRVPDISPALNGLIVSLLSDDPARPPPSATVVASRLRALAAEAGTDTLVNGPGGDELPPTVEPESPPPRGSDGLLIAAAAALCLFGVAAAFAITRTGKPTTTVTITSAAIVIPRTSSFQPSTESVVSTAALPTTATTTQTVVPPVTLSTVTTAPLVPIPPAGGTPSIGPTTSNGIGGAGSATVVIDATVTFNGATAHGIQTYTRPVTATANGLTTVTTVTFTVNQSGYTNIVTYTQPVTVTIRR